MRYLKILLVAALTVLVAGCATVPTSSKPGTEAPPQASDRDLPTLILISLDGFRWDFLRHGATPTLSRLAAQGVHAERLIPSFTTKTFPNHYTVVTGLRPAEHGLVANNVHDPRSGERFGLSNREAVADGKWYGGEPIWVTAERLGIRTAPLFWPGSEAKIRGLRPSISLPYDGGMSPEQRVGLVLGWLEQPPSERPGFLTLYFEDVDDGAHMFGPEPSEGLGAALNIVDHAVERLIQGLELRGLESSVDLLIISDHGMSATSRDRVILLDDYVDPEDANVVDWSPILGLWPSEEKIDAVYRSLAGAHPNLAIYRREDIPQRFAFANHERIPLIVGISDDGWSITTRKHFNSCPRCFDGGSHGYDQWLNSMGGLLIAHGPSFRRQAKIGPIENFHLYNVMCAVLGIEPAKNSGDPMLVRELLRQR
jgi:predicted AlkP superfamily pyrophosphatase or phosphodiesterase